MFLIYQLLRNVLLLMCLVYKVSLITVISSQLKRNHQNKFCKAATISQCVNEPFFFHLAMLSCDTVQFALIETMIVHLVNSED